MADGGRRRCLERAVVPRHLCIESVVPPGLEHSVCAQLPWRDHAGYRPQHHVARYSCKAAYVLAENEQLTADTNVPSSAARHTNKSYRGGDVELSTMPLDHSVVMPSFMILLMRDPTAPPDLVAAMTDCVIMRALRTLRDVAATPRFQQEYAHIKRLLRDPEPFKRWCSMYLARLLISCAMQELVFGTVAGMCDQARPAGARFPDITDCP